MANYRHSGGCIASSTPDRVKGRHGAAVASALAAAPHVERGGRR